MADEVALSAAVRSSLLSLQDTSILIARTEKRLSTGLRVSSAVDDPVAFFQAKALSDRAFDFQERKDGIDQGISTITAALNAVEALERMVQQMKGMTQSMKSAKGTQLEQLVDQFGEIRTQINRLTADATYQGVNLINGTGQLLEVEFSEKTNSLLVVDSVDLTHGSAGLDIGDMILVVSGDSGFEAAASTSAIVVSTADYDDVTSTTQLTAVYTFTYKGPDDTFATGNFEVQYGDQTYTLRVDTGVVTVTNGQTFDVAIVTGGAVTNSQSTSGTYDNLAIVDTGVVLDTGVAADVTIGAGFTAAPDEGANYVYYNGTPAFTAVLHELDSALTTLRGQAGTLGSNVALLKTRLQFTTDYVNTLEGGAGKLTLADINEEGANLLALQTRQQLGISALAFAGQAEQSILALFN